MIVRNHAYSSTHAPIQRVDMTPWVDLAFLLLIFFMFLLTLQTPKVMEISMPEFMGCGPMPVSMPHTTLIVGPQNKVYVYENSFWREGKVAYRVFENEPKQLEKYLRQLALQAGKVENRKTGMMQDALSVWIKPEDSASYEDVISVLNMVRNLNIRQHGLADITENDMDFLKSL